MTPQRMRDAALILGELGNGKMANELEELAKLAEQPAQPPGDPATEHRCTRCNGLAKFVESEGVWRHAGEPHQQEHLEQSFCDRYGYPIEVKLTKQPPGDAPAPRWKPGADKREIFEVIGQQPLEYRAYCPDPNQAKRIIDLLNAAARPACPVTLSSAERDATQRSLAVLEGDADKVKAFNLLLTAVNPTVRRLAERYLEGVKDYDAFVEFLRKQPKPVPLQDANIDEDCR